MAVFNLKIVTPEGVFFSGKVEEVKMRGLDGYFEILANHMNTMTIALDSIRIRTGQDELIASVEESVVKVNRENVVVLTNSADWA